MTTEIQHSNKPQSKQVSDETILKVAKEIAVKFIEVGRLTPTSFPENFTKIHSAIEKVVNKELS